MTNYRDSFYTEIQKGLVGTGSDIFGVPDSEELISDYPLNRYYSGILFPQKDFPTSTGNPLSEEDIESSNNQSETDENDYDNAEERQETGDAEEKEEGNEEDNSQTSDTQDYQLIQNAFFPTHIGFTFCIEPKKFIGVNFSFGIYDQLEPPQPEIKIAISKEGFESFFDAEIETQLSFKDILTYNDGFMQLSRKLNGSRGGREKRSGEYLDFDKFRNYKNIGTKEVYKHIHILEKLLGRIWKREAIEILNKEIPVANTKEPVEIFHKEYGSQVLSVCYMVKTYEYKGNNYVKILLLNNSSHPSNKYSNSNENLNRKCLFQTNVSVENISLKPYKSQSELHPFDEEQNEINFIYRDIKSYGVGHNCSVQWNDSPTPTVIQTAFMPERIVYGMKNDFSKEDFPNDFDALNKCLEVKQLSHFNDDKQGIIKSLKLFVSLYEKWIATQQTSANNFQGEEKKIANNLVSRQEANHKRLIRGIEILEKDDSEKAFHCFQLANTAMFIQMIISNDRRFGNKERHLTDEVEKAEYSSLKFFEDYNDWTFINPDKPEPPRYRPFQLAFMLLCIEGIIDENSDDRNKIVDLIWFPTGGGKTEAYLTATAFTILWRRLSNNAETSKGTSILMRYTLRLLTSQQFERASRLILALEFLRRNFESELHKEKISIGLWVGEGASPNRTDDANKIVEDATGNFEKADQYTSRLQLTACPWCGTKLVSKTATGWTHGYDCQAGTQGYFYFKCVNNKCAFHASRLPIQVVDEMLYKQPPTLLFATVDKFAILASQKEGETHKFFNSFSDSLPPDLIIQDELHLISGPLGSIVGIFESVIDYLCSKGNRKPKIISSTATTRNTSHQISDLYAGKQVNIFPPSGISYSDSFFAKETISKRKYVGFLPTGKTGINTQLWVLPYLLFTRIKLFNENELKAFNLYWTIVSYYNSLKDVGKIYNKTNDEIQINTNVLFYRHFGNNSALRYLIRDLDSRSLELTSRIESNNIKATLKRLEDEFATETSEKGNEYVKDGLDLVLASNMISVGIDVSRLNVMLVNGMPRNIAEYIQASSRVGRKHDGIVFSLFNPNQARDKSYFENFNSFHQAYYKFVEPLSVTPFTENTIRKMLTTMFVAFMRNSVSGLTKNSEAKHFEPEMADAFKTYITGRFGNSDYLNTLLDDLIKSWAAKKKRINNLTYATLLKKTSTDVNPFEEIWLTMNSLRDIDTETYYRINDLQTN
ncbi:MAG: helicase [Hydrotalea sp. AMD]|uniref:helicase-related protein n=1 Tax=Hydrotalea TaxID=1004300 RepID=UPI0009431022|nr:MULTISPECIES: helicase-related protein [Hydrotalea]RWZ86988.1 MAG: helicase [Hydrotalea sp. AMD]